ncbi:MAG: 6,7-dimethyl-8-ribityllumazine synthase [Thaumarchaeota archaeon]|nr:6,7-dimethyl-8-ribityllumazine synthase [Nitrososphaerota archaeon]MDE0526267.1 6,7-dimethyl-8-ribityllumazine synthase [Nitrososphaerota archaeon]
MRISIVAAEFNYDVTSRMYEVAKERAAALNLEIVHTAWVPGVFDMPVVADALLRRDDVDGVAAIGAVIKGQTKHDEVIAHSTTRALADLSVKHGKPVSLGVTGPGMQERHAFARIRPVAERAVEALLKIDGELAKIRM